MIKLENIDKVYDNGFQAVFNFNADINDNEFIVLVGPSGCGKSTMIRTIAGLEKATRGKIILDGEDVTSKSANERGIAMVFQSYALYPHLSVAENMGFALSLAGYDEDFIEKRVLQIATILGLETLLDRKPRQLSGGQRQRVAVGRAIIRHPKLFLMDEPLSNLDAKQRVLMRSEIIQIHRRTKATTIYVTHDQTEAMTMADKIICMKDGRIQQLGTPYDLYFKPFNKFVASFLGEPPMNFFEGKVSGDAVLLNEGKVSVPYKGLKKFDGNDIIFGFRPEAAVIANKLAKDQDGFVFTGKVEFKELLGDIANLYVEMGKYNFIIKVAQDAVFKENDEVKFIVERKDMYFFDAESEETIYDI